MAKKAQDTVIFSGETKHGRNRFPANVAIRFEDPDAAPYFVKCGWAEFSDKEPQMTFTEGEVEVDPETVFNETGLKVADAVLNGE